LAARGQDLGGVLGTVFSSSVFPNQSREAELLLRTMVGGGIAPVAAALDDQELTGLTRNALSRFFGEERAPPSFVRIYRHARGIPQYTIGHLGRVRYVHAAEARLAGMVCVGNHLEGIGVKDCARAGERAAARITDYLACST
jgi:oxygen-dependent protoporphyrinogen oxidase